MFLTGYTKRKKITIDNTKVDADLTDFPVLVNLNEDTDIGASALSTGYDIRFTSSDGETLLKYERQDFAIATGKATGNFWVKVPSVSSSADTEIYIYYGKADATDGADPTNVWDSNYNVVFHMNDATTSTIADSTSNGRDGTKASANNPAEATGKIGKAQSWTADSQSIGFSPGSFSDNTFTIQLIAKRTDDTVRQIVAGGTTTPTMYQPEIQSEATNDRLSGVANRDNNYVNSSNDSFEQNIYYLIHYTVNGTANKLFINGANNGSFTAANNPAAWAATIYLGIARTGVANFRGIIDEFRISNVVRSDAWIKADYNSCFNTLLSLGAEEISSVTNTLIAGAGILSLTGEDIELRRSFNLELGFGSIGVNGFLEDIRYREYKYFELYINGIDREGEIIIENFIKEDNINDNKDTLKFRLVSPTFTPNINEEVILYIKQVKEFGGVITEIEKSIQSNIVVYDITCLDYSQYLNRKLVTERYENKTADYIINDILSTYATDFTDDNVNCPITIKTITFNRMTISECLEKLSNAVGYSWYVDYDKDIHFFQKNENPAPFIITDTNGKYEQDSLVIRNDLSQIRNLVVIRGSEERGTERTEEYISDGEQITFPLVNKFAEIPAVNIESTTMLIGTDFLSKEEDYECFWNFNEKYVRFKDTTKPAEGEKVSITGIPLFPIIVSIPDSTSIRQYGYYEFYKEDKTIKSRQEALEYASAQIEAYKDGIIEGGFTTTTEGLRSGQVITINSTKLSVSESFLIQSVVFRIDAYERGIWNVKVASLRTIGIIQVLQDLIRKREIKDYDPDNLLTFINLGDSCGATALINTIATSETKNYVWVNGEGAEQPIIWNMFTWA